MMKMHCNIFSKYSIIKYHIFFKKQNFPLFSVSVVRKTKKYLKKKN